MRRIKRLLGFHIDQTLFCSVLYFTLLLLFETKTNQTQTQRRRRRMSSNTKTNTLSSSSSSSSLSHEQKSNGVFGDVYAILKDVDILPNAFRFQLPHQAQVDDIYSTFIFHQFLFFLIHHNK